MVNESWVNLSTVIGEEYGNYEISNTGKVKRLSHSIVAWNRFKYAVRKVPSKYLKTNSKDKDGYMIITILGKTFRLHRLICMAFLPNPEKLPIVNHKNGIKDDNRIENLEWTTLEGNASHAIESRLSKGPLGKSNVNFKISDEDVLRIDKLLREGVEYSTISKMLNVSRSYISIIKTGRVRSNITNRPYKGRTKKFHGMNINEVNQKRRKKMDKPNEIDWEWSEGDLEILRDTVMGEVFDRLDKEEGEEDVIRSNEQK